MKFTDNDLIYLKKMVHHSDIGEYIGDAEFPIELLKSLLARLEKAEVCVNLLLRTSGQYSDEIKAWCKVSGK